MTYIIKKISLKLNQIFLVHTFINSVYSRLKHRIVNKNPGIITKILKGPDHPAWGLFCDHDLLTVYYHLLINFHNFSSPTKHKFPDIFLLSMTVGTLSYALKCFWLVYKVVYFTP